MASLTSETLRGLTDAAALQPSEAIVRRAGGGLDVRTAHADTAFYPASMIKTALVAVALADVESGRLSLAGDHEVHPANITENDAPSPLVPGYRATLEEICGLALSYSDNVATNMLFDIVGREHATVVAREVFGLRGTRFARKLSGSDPLIVDREWDGVSMNEHSPPDAARLFERIALDRAPKSSLIRRALFAQYWNDKLSVGLREGDCFAHKTGDTTTVTHDGGILRTVEGNTYIVVVYTGLPSNQSHNERFASFMRSLRTFL